MGERKPRQPIQVVCVDCGCKFMAITRKALRCEKCNEEHTQIRNHSYQEKAKAQRMMRSIKKPPMTISEVIRATAEYNKTHNTHISEGKYVSLMERGLLDGREESK